MNPTQDAYCGALCASKLPHTGYDPIFWVALGVFLVMAGLWLYSRAS